MNLNSFFINLNCVRFSDDSLHVPAGRNRRSMMVDSGGDYVTEVRQHVHVLQLQHRLTCLFDNSKSQCEKARTEYLKYVLMNLKIIKFEKNCKFERYLNCVFKLDISHSFH